MLPSRYVNCTFYIHKKKRTNAKKNHLCTSKIVVVADVEKNIESFPVAVAIRRKYVFMKRTVHANSCKNEHTNKIENMYMN